MITRKFVCLSNKDQEDVPTMEEKRELCVMGLEEKKISLPEGGSNGELHSKVQEIFPDLQNAGGFELLYTNPGKKLLAPIPTGPSPRGNSVDYVAQFIGQGKVYIRPIQENIGFNTYYRSSDYKSDADLQETCKNCLDLFPMNKLKEHTKARKFYLLLLSS